jgi:hypothetical protein
MTPAPKPAAVLLVALLLGPTFVLGGEWDPKMDPPLGLSFPLESKNDRVVVSQDVLIAADKVLPAGTVLRTVFRPATIAEGEDKNRRGIDENAFSRDIPKVTTKGLMTETERKMLQRAYETVWTDPIEFRRGFETAAPANLRIVLEPAPGVSPPPVEPLDFPDGLCIVAGEDALRVLTVLKGGRGEKSAFRGGDVLLEMAGQPVGTSLTGFAERYRKEREVAAKKREPLRFKIRRTSGETELLSLRIPPAWNSAFEE